ncbi:hypothetical protein AB0I54_10080 [Streptomyces sp. NPDC050625]|uniref:hypothetical protein n=1 Tax=Streptomyces sp. NPDC050625 TaxID=3154629 RepID=UPI0034213034
MNRRAHPPSARDIATSSPGVPPRVQLPLAIPLVLNADTATLTPFGGSGRLGVLSSAGSTAVET